MYSKIFMVKPFKLLTNIQNKHCPDPVTSETFRDIFVFCNLYVVVQCLRESGFLSYRVELGSAIAYPALVKYKYVQL